MKWFDNTALTIVIIGAITVSYTHLFIKNSEGSAAKSLMIKRTSFIDHML